MHDLTLIAWLLPILEILCTPVLGFVVLMFGLGALEFTRAAPVLRIFRPADSSEALPGTPGKTVPSGEPGSRVARAA